MIKVSIIIPIYNAAVYIERCLDSVMRQNFTAIECIIIDDCSPDNSMQLINDMLSTYSGVIDFKVLYHKQNLGAAAARNLGLNHATGSYIYFLDGDDLIYPDCLDLMIKHFDMHPGLDIVLADMECENELMNRIFTLSGKNLPAYTADKFWIHSNFLVNIPVSPCNKLIRKSFILDHQLYFKEGIVNEDVLWMFFLSKYVSSIAFCHHKTYYYHYNNSSVTTSLKNEERRMNSWMIVIDTYMSNIDKQLKWIENFNALKLLHHLRFYHVSAHHDKFFQDAVKQRIRHASTNKDIPTIFRMMHRLLLTPVFLNRKRQFLWNKCLGILYRISMAKDGGILSKMLVKGDKNLNIYKTV